MTGGNKDEDLPLHDEAKAREKWRGGETFVNSGGKNLGLPASEVDDARLGGGVGDEEDGRPGDGSPGTFAPPD